MGERGCLAFGCFRTVWFHAVLGFAGTCLAQESAQQPEDELVDDVAQQLADFFRGEPAPAKPPARRVRPNPDPAPPEPTPARDLPEERDPTRDATDEAKGTVGTLGPFRFVIPAGWGVAERHSDGSGLTLGPGGVKSWPRYITFLQHPGFPRTAHTLEGIYRFIQRTTKGRGTTAAVKVGKNDKYSGLWFSSSLGGGYVLFSSGGSVYMLGYGSSTDTETLREVLRSIEPQRSRVEDVVPREPSSPGPSRKPEELAEDVGRQLAEFFGDKGETPLPSGTDEVIGDVSGQLADFFGSPAETPAVADADAFAKARDFTRSWEGGYVNDPDDAGGATNFGITQRTYDRFRKEWGQAARAVRDIAAEEVSTIYQSYWESSGAEDLPAPLSAVHFDSFFHFNPRRAETWKNEVVKAHPHDPVAAAKAYVEKRIAFRHERVKKEPSQQKFLKGWLNRDHALMELVTDGSE